MKKAFPLPGIQNDSDLSLRMKVGTQVTTETGLMTATMTCMNYEHVQKYFPCFAHSLHLVVKDVIKQAKVSSIVTHVL